MSVIKNTLKTILPRSMKELLIKKVTLSNITEHSNFIVINLSLKNFYTFNLNDLINVTLNNGEYVEELEYSLGKNMLSIQFLKSSLIHLTGNSSINVSVNDKHMIIDDDGTEKTTSFFNDGKYYNILANGTLLLEHLFEAYTFTEKLVNALNITRSYEHLKVSFDASQNLEPYDLVLLYQNKIVELGNIGQGSTLEIKEFNGLTMGAASVYIMKDFELSRLHLTNENTNLVTYGHNITFISESNALVAQVTSHELEMTEVHCNLDNDDVLINLSYSQDFELEKMIVGDTVSGNEKVLCLNKNGDMTYSARVPISVLIDNFTRKKFSLVSNGLEPVVLQPNVDQLKLFGFSELLMTDYNYEKLKLFFYKRKDKTLGFKVTRPRIKREVTSIDQFNLIGYIKGQENFID